MTTTNVTFEMTDQQLVQAIVLRYAELHYRTMQGHRHCRSRSRLTEEEMMQLQDDILSCHLYSCPLRLADLLKTDDFNLAHDLVGIHNHMDLTTRKMSNKFLPRFSR